MINPSTVETGVKSIKKARIDKWKLGVSDPRAFERFGLPSNQPIKAKITKVCTLLKANIVYTCLRL